MLRFLLSINANGTNGGKRKEKKMAGKFIGRDDDDEKKQTTKKRDVGALISAS